jgi:hypothetical protein
LNYIKKKRLEDLFIHVCNWILAVMMWKHYIYVLLIHAQVCPFKKKMSVIFLIIRNTHYFLCQDFSFSTMSNLLYFNLCKLNQCEDRVNDIYIHMREHHITLSINLSPYITYIGFFFSFFSSSSHVYLANFIYI